jgi:hypothetical protein
MASAKHIFLGCGGTITLGWGSEGNTDGDSREISKRKGSVSHLSGI